MRHQPQTDTHQRQAGTRQHMKICSISRHVGSALKDMGHDVLCLWPQQPVFDLKAALDERAFTPELIFQEESLGTRVLLQGVQHYACPKVFWSLDTHLNLHWQSHYFRLFDGVLTPHESILQKDLRSPHPPFARMAMFGQDRPWKPFSKRLHGVAFVGRITEHRPVRRWLAEFLEENFQAAIAQELAFPKMLDLYCDSRLAPNESLLGEVNFRLLEAASCGCLVLCQEVGPDQDALFACGQEIETYAHVLELKALLDHYAARPDLAERLGRAAWERVQREHLARHRAQTLLDFAAGLAPSHAKGNAETAHTLARAHLQRAGMVATPWQELAQALGKLPPSPEALAARMTILTENGPKDAALGLLYRVLSEGLFPAELEVNLTGSLAGLFLDDWSLSKQFWYRHTTKSGANRAVALKNPANLCLLWAKELVNAERLGSQGFPYDPSAHLPKCAVECLYLAQRLDPEDLETTRRLAALTSTLRGSDYIRLGHLSHLALHAPEDWRTSLQLAMTNLRAFRLHVGLEEILLARNSARRQGKEESFLRTLSALDPKGNVLAAVKD